MSAADGDCVPAEIPAAPATLHLSVTAHINKLSNTFPDHSKTYSAKELSVPSSD